MCIYKMDFNYIINKDPTTTFNERWGLLVWVWDSQPFSPPTPRGGIGMARGAFLLSNNPNPSPPTPRYVN